MTTAEEKFRKILEIVSPILLALNQGKYADIDYRMMSIKPDLKNLRAEIEPQKTSLEHGTIKLIYRENENRVFVFTTSMASWRLAQIISQALKKEKIRYANILHLAPTKQKGE